MKKAMGRFTSSIVRCRLTWAFCLVNLSLLIASVAQEQAAGSTVTNARLPKNTVIATITVQDYPQGIVVSPDNTTVYVANAGSHSVSVIDAMNNYAVKATIAVGNGVFYVTLSPDGKTLYASNYLQPGVVSVIDTTQPTYPVTWTLAVGSEAQGLAVSPDGKELYITSSGSLANGEPGSVFAFDTTTYGSTTIQTNGSPFLVLFTKNGRGAGVLNGAGTGFVQIIRTGSGKVSSASGAAGEIFFPDGMTSDVAGTTLYITSSNDYVFACRASDGGLIRRILAAPSVSSSLALGQPALTLNAKFLYVPTNYDYYTGDFLNQVVMIDVDSGKVVGAPITVGQNPVWSQTSPDGKTLYVSNAGEGTVSVVDVSP